MKALDRLITKLVIPTIGKHRIKKEYYYSRNYIESILKKYESPSIYLNLLELSKNRPTISTNTAIRYSNKINFGDSFSKVKALKNSNVRSSEEVNAFSILFSRTRIGNYRAKLIMYFYKGKLFGHNYTFSHLEKEGKNHILEILKEKYLEGSSDNILNSTIKDRKGNCLIIEDQVDLIIHYLKPDDKIYNHLNLLVEEEKKNKRLLIDYQKKELHSRL